MSAVQVEVREIGESLVVVWLLESGLARKLTALKGHKGAQYGREVSPGEWRFTEVPGSNQVEFETTTQLIPFVQMMAQRG